MLEQSAEPVGRRRGPRVWILTGVIIAAVLAGVFALVTNRGYSWRGEVAISFAELAEPSELWLGVGTCGANPEIDTLKESDEAVEISIVSTHTFGGPGNADCMDIIQVELAAPLGDRPVIDRSSGKEVTVGNR